MTKHWVHKFNLVMFDSVKNTNREAQKLSCNAERSSYVVYAKEQTDGKDRHGKTWSSPKGNFYSSIALHPTFTVQSGGQLALVISMAIKDALTDIFGINYAELKFQWPSDIMLNGKKIGGILLEASSTPFKNIPAWFVAGIGVNLISHNEDSQYPTSSLKEEGFGEILGESLLNAFMTNFSKRYNTWHNRSFKTMKLEWLESAYGLNEPMSVHFKGEVINGVFEGIDDDGALLLRLKDGQLKKIMSSEVFFDHVSA